MDSDEKIIRAVYNLLVCVVLLVSGVFVYGTGYHKGYVTAQNDPPRLCSQPDDVGFVP